MNNTVSEIINLLKEYSLKIGTMESCTSGLLATTITDVPGASSILEGSLVTYSNKAKIEAGVSPYVISKFGVYSEETAHSMAEVMAEKYDIGVGVTGTLGNHDPANADGQPGVVHYAIHFKDGLRNSYTINVPIQDITDRRAQKEYVCQIIIETLLGSLKSYEPEQSTVKGFNQEATQKVNNEFPLEIPLVQAFDKQFVDDVMCSALEGGISYWACICEVDKSNMVEDCEYLSDVVSNGGILKICDLEEDDYKNPKEVWSFGLTEFKRGLEMYYNRQGHGLEPQLDAGYIDADHADVIVQLGLFGKIVYA